MGIGNFIGFYYYTMIYILYYTGVRAGELCVLKWRDIKINEVNGRIRIIDSINPKEKRAVVEARHAVGINETKNEQSVRDIPMFETYRPVLLGYKDSYKKHFNIESISDDDFNDLYFFPYVNRDHNDPTQYFRQANVRRTIGKLSTDAGLDNYDVKCFRHACAHYLCYVQGLSEDGCHDYFGHKDNQMIKSIYLNLSKEERYKRIARSLQDVRRMSEDVVDNLNINNDLDKLDHRLIEKQKLASEERHRQQIMRAISKGQKIYKVAKQDTDIVKHIIRTDDQGLLKGISFEFENDKL